MRAVGDGFLTAAAGRSPAPGTFSTDLSESSGESPGSFRSRFKRDPFHGIPWKARCVARSGVEHVPPPTGAIRRALSRAGPRAAPIWAIRAPRARAVARVKDGRDGEGGRVTPVGGRGPVGCNRRSGRRWGPVSRAHARTHMPTFHLRWSAARLQIFFPIFTGQRAIFEAVAGDGRGLVGKGRSPAAAIVTRPGSAPAMPPTVGRRRGSPRTHPLRASVGAESVAPRRCLCRIWLAVSLVRLGVAMLMTGWLRVQVPSPAPKQAGRDGDRPGLHSCGAGQSAAKRHSIDWN